MDRKAYLVVLTICGGSLLLGDGATADVGFGGDSLLQIHLPREIRVEKSQLNLGQISVVRGPNAMVAQAATVGLGRFSVPGQKLVLDRPTILSRLASSGIPATQVRFTGAEAVFRTPAAEDYRDRGLH